MARKLIITFIIFVVIAWGGAVLALRDRPLLPNSPYYRLKLCGEWLEVNFLIFEAPAKQAKHLEYSHRRLEELLQLAAKGQSEQFADFLSRRHELELARSEFMAEQLALLDPRYIVAIQMVYEETLRQLAELWRWPGDQDGLQQFAAGAQLYNAKAIKTLIQKHWRTDADFETYRALVWRRLDIVRSVFVSLSLSQQNQLAQAEQILNQGREIEWAYDIISSVK